MRLRKKLAYVSAADPNDIRSWSGTHYHIYSTLSKSFDITHVAPQNIFLNRYNLLLNRLMGLLSRLGVGKYNHSNSFVRSYFNSKSVQRKLDSLDVDFILAVAASSEIAYLKSDKKIFYISDTTFGQYSTYYDKGFSLFSVIESELTEKLAIRNAYRVIYPSNWAKNFASIHYDKREKYHVFPFGSNFVMKSDLPNVREYIPEKPLQLLFIGVDWERKGGPIVYETFQNLSDLGYNVQLTIVGCNPQLNKRDGVIVYPRLDKRLETDTAIFIEIMKQSDLLFVPSRAECYGIVFAEASAFGIPCLTSDTGGIETAVMNGINGYRVSHGDDEMEQFTDLIIRLLGNPTEFNELRRSTYARYLKDLNWDAFCEKLINTMLGSSDYYMNPGLHAKLKDFV